MITGFATLDPAVAAMRHGAFHYIAKPFKLDEVRKVVKEALHKSGSKENRTSVIARNYQASQITPGPFMRAVETPDRSPTDCNVLITGESAPARSSSPGSFT
jgi:DNA-binding NtrC family response regulator